MLLLASAFFLAVFLFTPSFFLAPARLIDGPLFHALRFEFLCFFLVLVLAFIYAVYHRHIRHETRQAAATVLEVDTRFSRLGRSSKERFQMAFYVCQNWTGSTRTDGSTSYYKPSGPAVWKGS